MKVKSRVLLVDDDPDIIQELVSFLERAGYAVAAASNGEEALRQVAIFVPDLIALDVIMPGLDGREVLRRLRQAGNWTPVILFSQVGESYERAMALDEGADDYLNKPFTPYELVARIRAVLRRAHPGHPPLAAAQRLVSGSLVLDRVARRVWLGSTELTLGHKAMTLLEYLMTHPGEELDRERLLNAVWGYTGTRALDTRISELRQALGDDPAKPRYIETIPGKGYCFVAEVRDKEFP